ncbi:SDR family oxidoreductase [Actinoplanes sp. NPDC051411]|uniref:SDR family NAD(P)-dependent oxidoreductase n=1 Tax=Actinoplanes sp. NPDC051411 TaxID=3155522 RepID=UPI0034194CB1
MTTVLVVGATRGTGRELATEYARRGADVIITGRSKDDAARVAAEIGGSVTGLALDLTKPAEIEAALEAVPRVDRVALVGMVRDQNTVHEYDIVTATELATTKIVGNAAVVSALRTRLTTDASVLLFGGAAKDYPYPGSTTLSAVNASVVGLVRTLTIELAPVRVNSIHTWAIEDSPYWAGNTSMLDPVRHVTLVGRLARMRDVVDACLFLLENPMANGIDLPLNGGRA